MQQGENGLKSGAERIALVIDRVEMLLDFRMNAASLARISASRKNSPLEPRRIPSACRSPFVEFERLAIFGERLVVAAFEKMHRRQQKMAVGRLGFWRRLRHREDFPLRGDEFARQNIDAQQRPFEFVVTGPVLALAVMGEKGRHVGGRVARSTSSAASLTQNSLN